VLIGSLEGDGSVALGNLKLTVTGDTRNTEYSGVMTEGNFVGGSLAKEGAASFTLTGANTYTGGTTVSAGNLVVANKVGSATGSGVVLLNGAALDGGGMIAGAMTIGTGSGTDASLAPAHGMNKQATLTIQSALTFSGGRQLHLYLQVDSRNAAGRSGQRR